MKSRISGPSFAILLIFINTLCNAQGVWEVQNPLPTAEPLIDVYSLPNSSTAWAVGSAGSIVKTVDGGNSWTNLNSGTSEDLYSIWFFDVNTGWVGGSNGTILKTINGGNTWSSQTSGTTMSLQTIQFVDKNTGWALGSDYLTKTTVITKTINGGTTWTVQPTISIDLKDMFFLNSSTGWACGRNETIYKTINGGSSWILQSSGSTLWLNSIYFVSSSVGWAVGDNGIVTKTTDGGINWVSQLNALGNTTAFDSYFVNDNIGYAVGYDYGASSQGYALLKTVNGGTSWTVLKSDPVGGYRAIYFSNSTSGLIVGNGIYKTTNGGTTWLLETTGVGLTLYKIYFVDENNGYAVGDFGTILKTNNGGSNWLAQTSGTTNDLKDVFFINANVGWAVGSGGTILSTVSGGVTWTTQANAPSSLSSVNFINTSTGWAAGYGNILKTTNGGSTWITQTNLSNTYLNYVRFFDANNGVAFGWPGTTMYKTINGGTTWIAQSMNGEVEKVFFIDVNNGWAINGANLLITLDGGKTWTTQLSNYTNSFFGLFFYDINKGWVFGRETILKTVNGGNTWTPEVCRTSLVLQSGCFVGPNIGWSVGTQGIILHYTDYSPTTQASNITATGTTYQNTNVSWTRGSGNQCALFMKQTNSGTCTPDVNVTYLPNATFGLGDQIGNTGWYCVYNGMGTSASISNLQANTSYRFQVCEYNFSPDFTHYNSTTATNNPITVTTAIAPPQITTSPGNITLCETLNTTFSVTASGTGLTYQWQVDAGSGYLNVTNGGVYSGSTTSTLSLTGIPANLNANKYHCIVSNTSGNATSNEAILTVNPLPVNPAEVTGNQVVCLNSSYPYNVPPVQYSTSYIWTYPTGFSGNSTINNITLTTASNAISGNITVKGINACGSGLVKSFPVSVRKLPGNSSQITGLNSVCTGSINVGYSTVTISDADYYVWSLPFEATGTSTTNSIMVNYGSNPLTGQITVKGHNVCGDGPQSVLPVSVNTVPAAIGTITGRSNVCKNEKNVLYAINPIPNASSYIWTLPTGLTGSNSTNSVSLSIGPEAFSGDLKVSGVNSCGAGTPIVFPVIVDAVPDAPGPISGPSDVCRGTSNILYTVAKSERAYSYTWELPDGTSETTVVNKIALNFDNNAISGYLSVTPNNSCGAGNISTAFLEVSVPSKPEIDSGNYRGGTCMANTPLRLSVKQPMQGYNYLWYKNGKLYNDANSTFLEDFLTSGDYSVEANLNGCKVQSDVFNVYYPDAPAKPSIFIHGPKVWYLACSNNKARDYKWYYNGDLIAGADKSIYVPNQKLGDYYVTISNDAGCYASSDVVKIPVNKLSIEDTDPFAGLTIYPNPNSGQFTLKTQNKIFGEFTISVLNQIGNEIFRGKFEKTLEQFSSQINLGTQSKGIYIVNLSINGRTSERKIIIE